MENIKIKEKINSTYGIIKTNTVKSKLNVLTHLNWYSSVIGSSDNYIYADTDSIKNINV